MSMTPQDFHSKLQQAAVIHNIALINRRTNDPENYRKAINEYEQALDLYIDCHDFYNYNAIILPVMKLHYQHIHEFTSYGSVKVKIFYFKKFQF